LAEHRQQITSMTNTTGHKVTHQWTTFVARRWI